MLAGVGLLVVAAAWWIVDEMQPVDEDVVREALPVIDEHLRASAWKGILSSTPGVEGIRWVCTEKVIETLPDGERFRVGLVAYCEEFARRDGALVAGSAFHQPAVYLVERGELGYRVISREVAKDGAGYSPSVRAMFSWSGAKRVLDGVGPDSPSSVAAAAFGLPPDTAIRTLR